VSCSRFLVHSKWEFEQKYMENYVFSDNGALVRGRIRAGALGPGAWGACGQTEFLVNLKLGLTPHYVKRALSQYAPNRRILAVEIIRSVPMRPADPCPGQA